jgi:DNA replicative helicase MCM subunit Mcm2 (Cdc46/Mcm family)
MEKVSICKIHGETTYALRSDGRFRCRKCVVDAVQKRRETLKTKAIEYKGGKCEICNYNKCVSAMEFHHIDPNQKDFAISSKGYTRSWEKVRIELEKCILVCSNCHREIHENIKKH